MTIAFCVSYVRDVMTAYPIIVPLTMNLQQAAEKMEEAGCGSLLVGTKEHVHGIITDRDIVVRALAHAKDPATEEVGDHMTDDLVCCLETDTLEEAARQMHLHKVSRMVVKDKEGQVTGIMSFGTIFRNDARPEEIVNIIKHAAGPVSV